jgi:hypothetical protein
MPSAWGEALMALGRGLPAVGQSVDTYNQNKWLKSWEEQEAERKAKEQEMRLKTQDLENRMLSEKLGEVQYQKGEREKAEKNFFEYLQDARDAKNIPQLAAEGPTQQHDRLVRLEEMEKMQPSEQLNEYGLIGGAEYSPKVNSYVSNVLGNEQAKKKAESQLALSNLGYQQDTDMLKLKSQLDSEEERRREAARMALEKEKTGSKSKPVKSLQQSSALKLSSTEQGIGMLDDLKKKATSFSLTNTPLDKLRTMNPWDKDIQGYNQLIKTTKQIIGKGLEEGVLRKEDEYKYDQIIPKLGDTEDVRLLKIEQLKESLINKYNTDLESLGKAGYDITGFAPIATGSTMNTDTGSRMNSNVETRVVNGYTYIKVPGGWKRQ